MSDQRVLIASVAYHGWYHRGISRMIEGFQEHCPGYELHAWVNVLPPGAPKIVTDGKADYTAYTAKPFALKECMDDGATIAILLDAAFYPVRDIFPLVDHIAQHGYYLCDNGWKVGQWSTDQCLLDLGVTRDEAMQMQECSSYCVGLNFANKSVHCKALLEAWCEMAKQQRAFVGPHTNNWGNMSRKADRNPGFVSSDQRVRGHRHDQSVLSILAHKFGMTNFTARPLFTTYKAGATAETVLVNDGISG